ncbi:hypothetical protein F5B21DRAFT_454695 [Xylaria acuta]|nr:hypothetical protein F5B21DRAFT_454695 [Xylaria acuta]
MQFKRPWFVTQDAYRHLTRYPRGTINTIMTAHNDKSEHSSTAKTQPSESHPSYRAIFRHVNCRKRSQSEKSSGFTPSCVSTVDWCPTKANIRHSQSSSDATAPPALETGCCGTDKGIVSENDVSMFFNIDLVADLERVALGLCKEQSDHVRGAVIIREYIMWENGPQKSSGGSEQIIHDSAVTPIHLALMRQRKCDDFIEVDFGTHYDDEEFRRESMLRALTKLSRRASSHCNR